MARTSIAVGANATVGFTWTLTDNTLDASGSFTDGEISLYTSEA